MTLTALVGAMLAVAIIVPSIVAWDLGRSWLQDRAATRADAGMYARLSQRLDEHELVLTKTTNLLGAHERLVTRVSELDETTKKALSDLASKWLAEVGKIHDTQSAAFAQKPGAGGAAFQPRKFSP